MNVLWIMTDQHRADCLGFMGHPLVQTPHLDRLAKRGVVFENAFCQSPVCMASRAVLFTGRYPASVRVRGMGILPPSETTFPEVLQRNGYRTGAFGKVHLTPEQWKLNIYPTASQQFGQLFNLTEDPDESRNLYHDSHYRNIREELLWQLLARSHLNTDPLPPYLTQY